MKRANLHIRKYLIAGNWKMNKNSAEAAELAGEITERIGKQLEVETVLCPPFTALQSVARVIENSTVKLGGQNMHPETSGAFTGEVSPEMLRHLFATFVILGHSERRTLFGENDEFINAKVLSALKNRLKPILCVGETLDQREANRTLAVVKTQLENGLKDVSTAEAENLVIAYEPVWAIGTGRNATPEQAQEVHSEIRKQLAERFSKPASEKIRILYGGSMKPANAGELLKQADIDGGLIGGASLEARSFVQIVQAVTE